MNHPIQIKHFLKTLVAVGLMFSLEGVAQTTSAALQVAKLFSDNMVLQQEKPIRIWGFDTPGTDVVVTLNWQSQKATTDKDGPWRVGLPAISDFAHLYPLKQLQIHRI